MKNPKNFDYDKKKPTSTKKRVVQTEEDSKSEDYNKIFKEPPLIKGLEISQNQSKNEKKIKKKTPNKSPNQSYIQKNNSNLKEVVQINSDKQEEKNENQEELENIGLIMPVLPETEILEEDEPLPEEGKYPNPNFCKNYVYNLLNSSKSEINQNILNGVESGLNKVLITVQDDMEENKLEINKEQKNVNEAKINNNSSIIIKNQLSNFESSIRMQKIKELNQRKKAIEKQINKIDENLRIEGEVIGNINGYLENPTSVVDENIKKAQIKENKQTKGLLLTKLNGINEQVERLMENEEELANSKKLNVKEFLENFEKNKEKIEEITKKYDEEKRIREKKNDGIFEKKF